MCVFSEEVRAKRNFDVYCRLFFVRECLFDKGRGIMGWWKGMSRKGVESWTLLFFEKHDEKQRWQNPRQAFPTLSITMIVTSLSTHSPTIPTNSNNLLHVFNKHSTLLHIRRIIRESGKSGLIREDLPLHRRRHRRNLRQKLAIHIPDIIGSMDRRFERRHDLLPHQLLPIDIRKPRMVHDVLDVVPQPRLRLSVEQSATQIECVQSSPLSQR